MTTYTNSLTLTKQATGDNPNTWGTVANTIFDLIDSGIAGVESYALSGSKTLSSTSGADNEARPMVQIISSGSGGTVTIPAVSKVYIVHNKATGTTTFKTSGGTGIGVLAGKLAVIYCDATDCYLVAGNTGWVSLTSTASTSVNAVTFTSITSTYSAYTDLQITLEGCSHTTSTVNYTFHMSDTSAPSTFSTERNIGTTTFTNSDTVNGSIYIPNWQADRGTIIASAAAQSGDVQMEAAAASGYSWRVANGIASIRIDSNDAFNGGTIRLWGRR